MDEDNTVITEETDDSTAVTGNTEQTDAEAPAADVNDTADTAGNAPAAALGAEKVNIYEYDADDEPVKDVDFYRDFKVRKISPAPEDEPERTIALAAAVPVPQPSEPPKSETQPAPEQPTEVPDPSELENVTVTSSNVVKINKIFMVNTVISMVTLCVMAACMFVGYAYLKNLEQELGLSRSRLNLLESKADSADENSTDEAEQTDEEYVDAVSMIEEEEKNEPDVPLAEDDGVEIDRGKVLIYDSYVGYAWVPLLTGVARNTYNSEDFTVDDEFRMKYTKNGELSSYFGIDVSSYQGDIDWNAARSDGVEFAILRLGVRGYGEEGNIKLDEKFEQNYRDAHDAGIDLGVYFYSQAISVEEAIEEAKFVLDNLDGRPLEYPIVFDWEPVDTAGADVTPRTEDVMPGTLTLSAIAFCETIKDAGYDAMIYTNKKMAYIKYDLRQLSDYPVWLALYSTDLTYRYDFDMWQYGFGQVDGIEGDVDLDIAIIR